MRFQESRPRRAVHGKIAVTALRAGAMSLFAVCALAVVPSDRALAQSAAPRESIDRPVSLNRAAADAPSATEKAIPAPTIEDASPAEPAPPSAPLAASPLTLDQAINLCLLNDPKIRSGFEAVNQAQADHLTASLLPNPEAAVGGSGLPRSGRFLTPGGPPEVDVDFGYPIDWFLFGKRAAAMASAAMGVRVSEADYADLVRQRVTEAAVTFFDVLEAKALLDVARQDVENLARVEAITRRAVENGGRPLVELHRIRLELLQARRSYREAESASIAAVAKLHALLGNQAGRFDATGSLDGPLTAEPLPPSEAYAMAVQNRPDVLSLRQKVSKAWADVTVERRNAFPEVKPTLRLGRQYTTSWGDPDMGVWGTGIEMTVPLFNRNQGNRAKSGYVVNQSNYDLQTGLLELRSEIEQAVQSLRTAQQNAASVAQDELSLAAQVRDAIGNAYAAGGRPLLDVLDAQKNYRETYRTFVTTRADYWRSLYKYNSAIGKQIAR